MLNQKNRNCMILELRIFLFFKMFKMEKLYLSYVNSFELTHYPIFESGNPKTKSPATFRAFEVLLGIRSRKFVINTIKKSTLPSAPILLFSLYAIDNPISQQPNFQRSQNFSNSVSKYVLAHVWIEITNQAALSIYISTTLCTKQ